MKSKIVLAARLLFGLLYTASGVVVLFGLGPQPEHVGASADFMELLSGSYLLTFVKITEISSGLLLLSGFLVPLALTMLAPITLNILVFHLALDPSGLPIAAPLLALHLFLAYSYRGSFRGVLDLGAKPTL